MGRPHLVRASYRRALTSALLALSALALAGLPQHLASAQIPPVDPCLEDPASCLPEAPNVDPCLDNPQSCLPDAPNGDPCLANPASCVPDPGPVDECVEDPGSCIPGGEPDEDARSPQDDDGGSTAPVPKAKPPQRPGGASSSGSPPFGTALTGPTGLASSTETASGTIPSDGAETGGTLEDLRRGLADATRRFAFPIGIIALVGAFLLVQGRLDRRDPKLAAAPIDSRDDLVVYR